MVLFFTAGGLGFLVPFIFSIISLVHQSRELKAAEPQQKILEPANEVQQALSAVRNTLWGETTPEIKAKVERLESTLGVLRPRLARLGSSTYHTVFSTATKYLPDAANAYVHITRDARSTEVVDGTKTATEVFCEQLDIMNTELKKALDEATKVDATDLVVHGRFLEEKYGKAEPVVEDVPEITAEAALESKIRSSFSVPDAVSGSRRVEIDSETITMRSWAGSAVAHYGTPEARYYAPGELPSEPKPFEPIPEGTYPVEVVDAQARTTAGGRQAFRLKLVVTYGQFAGHTLWKNLVIGETAQSVAVFLRQVEALGIETSVNTLLALRGGHGSEMFLGRFALARVQVDEYNGRVFNSVSMLTPFPSLDKVEA